jgi:CheY-like chemotaxis protein
VSRQLEDTVAMLRGIEEIEQHLEVGRPAILQYESGDPENDRFRTVLRGWRRGDYLLIEYAADADLRKGQGCVLRFLAEGKACAFDSTIVDFGSGQFYPFIRISWPSAINYVSVRKHERIPVQVPCKVTMESGEAEGEILDLSSGGCRLYMQERLERGAELKLHFTLPDGSRIHDLAATVQNQAERHSGALMGCKFSDAAGKLTNDIAIYVSTTLERMRAGDYQDHNRVIVIDHNPEGLTALQEQLQSMGIEVVPAPSLVDGVFRIRLSIPSAVLVNQELPELSGCEVCRILKGTPRFESLPVLVYGGNDPALEEKVTGAKGSAYFPSLDDVRAIAGAVAKCLPNADAEQPESQAHSDAARAPEEDAGPQSDGEAPITPESVAEHKPEA